MLCNTPAMFNPIYSSTSQQLFEKNLCNQSSDKIDFAVNNDEWCTKQGIGRMHFMYNNMAKGTTGAQVTMNSEKIMLLTLAIVELHLSAGISQTVSQSVEISLNNILKIFLKAFWVDLKACFGIVLCNHHFKEIVAGF